MTSRGAALAALLMLLAPRLAGATGAWTTYLHMTSCNDLIALRDTVWLATEDAGLVRYLRAAGRFESVTREPKSVASNALTQLAFDRSRRLWVGTEAKGLSRLSADGSTWDLVNAFDGLPSDSVTALTADGDTLWIGTTRGLALWDGVEIAGSVPDLGTPSPFRSNVITGIAVLRDSVFVSTTDGVYVALLSAQLNAWAALDSGIANTNVLALASDGHELFAISGGATWRWSMGAHRWSIAGGQGAAKALRDDFGQILCSTATGLWRWSGNGWGAVPGSPGTDNTASGGVEFGTDPDGARWAVASGALLEETPGPWISRKPPGPVGNDVQNVLVDGTRLWMNAYDKGVSRFDGSAWRNWPSMTLPATQDTSFVNSNYAFTLVRDAYGRKWIANWDAAVERIDDTFEPPAFLHVVTTAGGQANHTLGWASTADDSGYVYITGDTPDRGSREPIGIDVYDSSGTRVADWTATSKGLSDNQVRAIAISHDHQIWAGFPSAGVSVSFLRSPRDSVPAFVPIDETTTYDVFGIVAHGDSIWVLTTSNLLHLSLGKSIVGQYLIPASPAPRGAVHPLEVAPDGTVWVASTLGAREYFPGGGSADFTTANSPIADDEVRSIVVDPATGVVWFGTANGLTRYDPGYRAPAPPRIPALRLNVWPNPASLSGLGMQLRLSGNATSYVGEVLDLGGRVVNHFSTSGNGRVVWDGRDQDGRIVPPGIYFVHARGGGHEALVRVAVLH